MDIFKRLNDSSANESSHELQCRCFDAAEAIYRLRVALTDLCDQIEDTEEHGGGAHEPECPICDAIKNARELVPNG